MLAAPASLVETAGRLRSGALDLRVYLTALCHRVEAAEPRIRALVPETDRRERLLREAGAPPAVHPPLLNCRAATQP